MKKLEKTALVLATLLVASASLHAEAKITAPVTGKGTPKYMFVFVGDGMSYPQIQSAAYYAGKDAAGIVDVVKKSENPSDSPEMKALSFKGYIRMKADKNRQFEFKLRNTNDEVSKLEKKLDELFEKNRKLFLNYENEL